MPEVEKNCANKACNKVFMAARPNSKYCCPKCRKAANVKNTNEKLKKELQAIKPDESGSKKKKRKGKSIAQISADARKAGLTYGQYVAKMGL